MSAGRPTALGRFVKWFLVPVALAALGVFVVGPYLSRMGVSVPEKLKAEIGRSVFPTRNAAPVEQPKVTGEPEVEVTYTKAPPKRTTTRRRHRRPRHRVRATTPARTNVQPGGDQTPPPADGGG